MGSRHTHYSSPWVLEYYPTISFLFLNQSRSSISTKKKQVLNEELIYYPHKTEDPFFYLGPQNSQKVFTSIARSFQLPLLTQVVAKGSRVFCSQVEVLFC